MQYTGVPTDDYDDDVPNTTSHKLKFYARQVFYLHKKAVIVFGMVNTVLLVALILLFTIKLPHTTNNINIINNERGEEDLHINITFDRITVPNIETGYVCAGFTLSLSHLNQSGVIRFSPVIGSPLTHHLLLFSCERELPHGLFQCFEPPGVCQSILYAWAPGTSDIVLPSDISISLVSPFVLLQVHYNNPGLISNVIDSSGVTGVLTKKAKSHTASFLEVAVPINRINIPPGLNSFEINTTCHVSTDFVPAFNGPLNVIGSMLHMHMSGYYIYTELIRNGTVFASLGNEQTFRAFSPYISIQSGDVIITHCFYNTSGRLDPTVGGWGLMQEMCSNYVLYYPAQHVALSCIV